MGLCRSASGSRPAPVSRCCGGAARMEGRALPASSCLGRRRQRVPARRREGPSKSPRAAEAEGLGSRRRQARTSFFIRSAHGGQRPCLPLHAAGAWRTSVRHSEQSGQILRYGLPQIKKISVFCGQGPVDGAGVLWGRRGGTGKFPHSGGKSPMGWLRERRGKRSRNGEIPGSQDGKGRYWYPRTGRNAASGRGAKAACALGLHRKAPCRKGKVWPCGQLRSTLSIGMSRPTGTSAFSDSGPCPFCGKSCPDEACWEGEGV